MPYVLYQLALHFRLHGALIVFEHLEQTNLAATATVISAARCGNTQCEEGSVLKQKLYSVPTAHHPMFPYSVFNLVPQKCSLWNSNFVVHLSLKS
jgi:hypothetical protein